MRKKPSNSNKERILQYIQNNPGCHLRQIRNELDLSMGSVQYHSYQLQKGGKITSMRQGLYKLHFQSGTFEDHEKVLLQVLNQETPREIILYIIEQGDPTQTDVVKRLGISAPCGSRRAHASSATVASERPGTRSARARRLRDDSI